MKYQPSRELTDEQRAEFTRVADAFSNPELPFVFLAQQNAAPVKYADGMVVYADGVNWNPDAVNGEGVYCYYNSVWNYLG